MKYFILLIITTLFAVNTFAQGSLEVKNAQKVLKNLHADDQDMTVVYTVKNTGKAPVIISRVTPMTSLLKADWSKSPLLPNKTTEIRITFKSMQLQENFNMRILVYSNAKNNRLELTLSGNITDNPAKPELLYKYTMAGLKFKNNNINFGKVYTWQVASDTIEYYNTRQEAVKLGVIYKSNYLQAMFVPEQVAPGKKGKIILFLDAPKKNDYGYLYESLILSVNGSKDYGNRLSITAELKEDFSKLSKKELANAPIATFDKKECNFGEIKPNSKTNCDFKLTNTGKRVLLIRKTKASCGCTAVALGQNQIQPGESTIIRATFDSKGKSGRQYKTITVITNDPQHPESTLTINGEIKQ